MTALLRLLLPCLLCLPRLTQAALQPNILFIMADDAQADRVKSMEKLYRDIRASKRSTPAKP